MGKLDTVGSPFTRVTQGFTTWRHLNATAVGIKAHPAQALLHKVTTRWSVAGPARESPARGLETPAHCTPLAGGNVARGRAGDSSCVWSLFLVPADLRILSGTGTGTRPLRASRRRPSCVSFPPSE